MHQLIACIGLPFVKINLFAIAIFSLEMIHKKSPNETCQVKNKHYVSARFIK